MSCLDVRAEYLAGSSAVLEEHVPGCEACRAQAVDLSAMRSALSEAAVWTEPPSDLGERVLAAVTASERPAQQRRWLAVALTAAAAVLATVIGVAVWLSASAPDWEIQVAAGEEVSGTIAGWLQPNGTRVMVNLEGLEPAPPGFMYELWFSSRTTAISAGTFLRADGVELTVGVARVDFPRVWITREPVDGGPLPEGELVYDVMTTG